MALGAERGVRVQGAAAEPLCARSGEGEGELTLPLLVLIGVAGLDAHGAHALAASSNKCFACCISNQSSFITIRDELFDTLHAFLRRAFVLKW